MHALLPYLLLVWFPAAVPGFRAWPAGRISRRGTVGGGMSGALAAYEEAFRATSHASHCEIRAQAERKAPTDSPDGGRRRPKRG